MEKSLHMAIIPDGNRRWARTKGLLPWNGHERAIENFRSVLNWIADDGRVSVLSLWCFSTENWKRDEKEITELMRIYESFLQSERENFRERETRLVHSGRLDRIPASLAALITDIVEETKDYKKFTFHIALDYGGKDEVVRAIGRIPKGDPVTDEAIRSHVDHPELPDLDVILRTSGEQRTSNFFLWQSAYAEWVFVEKHFPELTTKDIDAALGEYERRQRRFGG